MTFPNITFRKIFEHDMDLLILEEFISDRQFARLFLDKLGLSDDYLLISADHSLSDVDGESDITFILQFPDKKVAVLIEDKIDAQTMPEQSKRYTKRAETEKKAGKYDSYFVMLAAPASYHEDHKHDPNANYEYRIYYEELLSYYKAQHTPRSCFKSAVIEFALEEKAAGYQVQEVASITEFWRNLRQLCKTNYPSLSMVGSDTPKGGSACWPEFRTSLSKVKVVYKSQKGFVDLEFPGYGDKDKALNALVKPYISSKMRIRKTGKSASIRIENPLWAIDFSQNFDECISVIHEILQAVSSLCELASKLDYYDLY